MSVINLSAPVRLNLNDTEDLPVAEGWYPVRIISSEAKMSSKDQPQIAIMARITDENSPDYNKGLFWYLTFAEDSQSFQIKMLKRCILALPTIDPDLNYPSYKDFADALVDLELQVHVKHGSYNDEVTANVNKFKELEYADL